MLISNKMRLPLLLLSLLAASTTQAQGQKGQSMEERLRAELRNVTAQLQQTRGELEMLKAKGTPAATAAPVAAPASDGLKKELARSQSQLAQERAQREKLAAEQQRGAAAAQEAAASLAQLASEQLAATGKQLAAERARLDGEVTAQRGALARCESKNAQLYATGQDILQAYESLNVLDVMKARQPFAAQSRVKLEQIAQQYGDQLYQGRFDARQTSDTPAPQ